MRDNGVATGAQQGTDIGSDEPRKPSISDLLFYYQPILGRGGHTVIYEALVRWLNPEGIILPPLHFLDDLLYSDESTLSAFTSHTIDSAARVLHDFNDVARLSINLSPTQVCRHETLAQLASLPGALRSRLMIEVTENSLPERETYSLWLGETAALGVDLVLDDMLPEDLESRLPPKLPVEGIKLDRSLLPRLTGAEPDRQLMDMLNSLKKLKLSLTVEGVERPGQIAELAALGLDRFQGYGLGMPLHSLAPLSQVTGTDTTGTHGFTLQYH